VSNPVHEFYGNRLRVRACGLCVENEGLLLIKHELKKGEDFWSPPGGGVQFGESVTECLIREFKEETGLIVKPKEFLFTTEFIAPPLHAIEFFFLVERTGGSLKAGSDPETINQIIRDARFVSWSELKTRKPESLHGIFQKVAEPSKIMGLRGYYQV